MIIPKNNIIVTLDKREPVEYAILNPISGSFDIMSELEYKQYCELESGKDITPEMTEYLIERGYLFKEQRDYERSWNEAYDEFHKEIRDSQIQLMLIPTYSCNLACTYCFQHGIDGRPSLITREAIDGFFDYIQKEFADAKIKPFITLFGGEPLINSKAQREIIEYIVEQCVELDYELSAVTNGYDFAEYADMLKRAKIKEIQFTLDGTQSVHDQRRMTANHKGSFDKVLAGIEKAVLYGMPVNLRTVTDKHNIDDLVNLAELLDQKGWLNLPPELFKTQVGRNYELFECYEKPEHLFSQAELWGYVSRLAEQYPVVKKFHRPDFMGLRYLVDTGEMYLASFDTCPAAKTEWVFDLYGDIYGCTASCGREDFKLGTYWPSVQKNETAIQNWKKRDVANIEKCKSCKYDVICGGGCGVVAANKNNGEILSPDCRPIQELYDIGLNFYRDDIKIYEDTEAAVKPTAEEKTKAKAGCIICGSSLVYSEHAEDHVCSICGKTYSSNIRCIQGHYVCDRCHNGDVLDHMVDLLIKSAEKNPVRLAEMVFDMPTMKMHGPEHHSMVPAVLETAHQNILGIRDTSKIQEAIKRGKDIKGGSCGFHGNCGACVGTGIAESIYLGATPKSKDERGRAMLATSKALLAVSELAGPLCCKRDSITSIKTYMNMSDRYKGADHYQYSCRHYIFNPDCLGLKCPYFPISNK
ncbi:DUF5714 domain-containing protein [Sinanaerobacter chloroacetimidivorans]|uniref:Radical SAM protein n=1 Tax=Sinanaerobacter chloroacetimidivorans TaxID=2818044 RepID=A0A8J7W358_9FIRM|nr:DUF5714 domain-containing protein [Sinanaerobacter chloroacetimidivorans]MBR0598528.1 radical SAM protein [Sinanaerobacter chloroacetimidivorans]